MSFQRTSEIVGGGEPIFHPGFMYCDMASSQHFRGSITRTGNKFTVVGSFYAYDYLTADDTYKRIFLAQGSNPSIYTYPTDHGTDPRAIIFLVRDNAATAICVIKAETPYAGDDQKINFLFAFDGDNGLAKLVINGVEEDDVTFSGRVAPTAGTLYTGARTVGICGDDSTGARPHSASVSFLSYANAYLPDAYSDFFDTQGNPIYQETTDWASTGWGAQPELYAPNGDPQDNLGSAGAFTAYNGPKVAYKKTALVYNNKGLATIGDATLRDIADGKYAWVNAQQVRGYGVPNPADISGCVVCLDALYPGNTVDQWDDLSGNGNHATKSAGQTMPTIGNGVCSWNGSSDECDLPSLASLTAGEIFILQRRYADNADTGVNTGWMSFGTRTDSFQDHFTYSSQIYSGFGRATRITVGNPTQATDAWHLIHIISAPSLWQFYFNEERMYHTTSNTVAFRSTPVIGGAGLGVFFQGEWKGMVLFNRLLTGLERAQVRGWLASL